MMRRASTLVATRTAAARCALPCLSTSTFRCDIRWQSSTAPKPPSAATSGGASAPGAVSQNAKPKPNVPFSDPDMTHFRVSTTPHPLYEKKILGDGPMNNTIWTQEDVKKVAETHRNPSKVIDYIALAGIKTLRFGFDVVSGYLFGNLTTNKILRRILFLETAAGIPGMVAGSVRHLRSLRLMRRDRGWINTLLEEAENERMHMLVFMQTHKPGLFFRGAVLITQGVFWNVFFFSYLLSPALCHRFVGYLEEEAVRTYTHILHVMDSKDPKDAEVAKFALQPAPELAIRYWKLPETANMRDVIMVVRADEANHRDVNHVFASIGRSDSCPFAESGHKH